VQRRPFSAKNERSIEPPYFAIHVVSIYGRRLVSIYGMARMGAAFDLGSIYGNFTIGAHVFA
jgi:hypothetical protein